MEWTKVESSQIAEVGYEPETETLGIRFKAGRNGKTGQAVTPQDFVSEYHYSFVEPDTYAALMTAESIGRYFGEHIKSNPVKYPYVKVA